MPSRPRRAQWGGQLHPLIPAFEERPDWWTLGPAGPWAGRGDGAEETPAAIEAAYRSAFACDFVVDARDGAPEQPGNGARALTLDQLRRDSGDGGIEGGLPATAIYDQLWNDDFRWQRRERRDVIIPTASDPALEAFVAACFGRFASEGYLANFESAYQRTFAAERVIVTPQTLLDWLPLVAKRSFMTPVEVATSGLRFRPRNPHSFATIVLVEPTAPSDLVDLWNLRASGRRVVPVPLCWRDELLPEIGARIAERFPNREAWLSNIVVAGAHRVDDALVAEAARTLLASGLDCDVQRFPVPGRSFGFPWVAEQEDEVEAPVRGGRVEVPVPEPAAAKYCEWGMYRWAVLFDYVRSTLPMDGSIAALLPASLGSLGNSLRVLSHFAARATEEGILLPVGTGGERL